MYMYIHVYTYIYIYTHIQYIYIYIYMLSKPVGTPGWVPHGGPGRIGPTRRSLP